MPYTNEIRTVSLQGLDAVPVTVEADGRNGLPHFSVVGLPDTSVQEAKERVRSACVNSGYEFPRGVIVVNLAPADVPKEGTGFDCAIALSILALTGMVQMTRTTIVIGELGLDGSVRPVPGVLAMIGAARGMHDAQVFVPADNGVEAALSPERCTIYAVRHFREIVDCITGTASLRPLPRSRIPHSSVQSASGENLADVMGNVMPKRALAIAAAGGHHLFMTGPPGSGKTMLARILPDLLPPLTHEEMVEVTTIHSVAGLLPPGVPILSERPFRSPHHTSSAAALVGGGRLPKPGEISLAHRGVLFLDELPEFQRAALEALRQPIESGSITVTRSLRTLSFPAVFLFVAAQNPCPCGNADASDLTCRCSPSLIERYRSRVSGPLLDRIDLHVSVPRVVRKEVSGQGTTETTASVRSRVAHARQRQTERYTGLSYQTNGAVPPAHLLTYCRMDSTAEKILLEAIDCYHLSLRAVAKIRRVARTIADLNEADTVTAGHAAEALQYRVARYK